jgi:hypothetical protein
VTTGGTDPDSGGWQPGDQHAAHARVVALGLGTQLDEALGEADQAVGEYMTGLGRVLINDAAESLDADQPAASLTGALADEDIATGTALGVLSGNIGQAAMCFYTGPEGRLRAVGQERSGAAPVA